MSSRTYLVVVGGFPLRPHSNLRLSPPWTLVYEQLSHRMHQIVSPTAGRLLLVTLWSSILWSRTSLQKILLFLDTNNHKMPHKSSHKQFSEKYPVRVLAIIEKQETEIIRANSTFPYHGRNCILWCQQGRFLGTIFGLPCVAKLFIICSSWLLLV